MSGLLEMEEDTLTPVLLTAMSTVSTPLLWGLLIRTDVRPIMTKPALPKWPSHLVTIQILSHRLESRGRHTIRSTQPHWTGNVPTVSLVLALLLHSLQEL